MKTLEEIKNDVANRRHFIDWNDLIKRSIKDMRPKMLKEVIDEVSSVYAEQALDEAIDKTDICCNNFYPTITLKQLVIIKNDLR